MIDLLVVFSVPYTIFSVTLKFQSVCLLLVIAELSSFIHRSMVILSACIFHLEKPDIFCQFPTLQHVPSPDYKAVGVCAENVGIRQILSGNASNLCQISDRIYPTGFWRQNIKKLKPNNIKANSIVRVQITICYLTTSLPTAH